VVATDVLGEEVLVEHRAEQQPPQVPLPAFAAMDQLVGGDDGEARASADYQEGDDRVEGEDALDAEQPDQLDDEPELERRERVDQRVEGPGRKRFGWLAPLVARRAVELMRQDQGRHEEERHVPRVGAGPEEEQRVGRQIEREQVPAPDRSDLAPRRRGDVERSGSGGHAK
jgi:hypothetical protein